MARLIYSVIASLDGYIADQEGNFDWAVPDDEVHTFINDLERPIRTYLYGRRMYEVMAGWETDPTLADQSPVMKAPNLTTSRGCGRRQRRSSTRRRWSGRPPPGPGSSETSTPRRSGR